jgi:hypothetical protein
LKVDLFVAILLKYWSCLTSVRYLHSINYKKRQQNYIISLLFVIVISLYRYVMQCLFENKRIYKGICNSIKILILFNFSKIPPFHQLQKTTTKLHTNSKQYHYILQLKLSGVLCRSIRLNIISLFICYCNFSL